MTTERRFCRFTRGSAPYSIHEIPRDGFCLSSFVLLSPAGRPKQVLLGRLNPSAPWDHLGGLGPDRVEAHRHGWTIPASQLIFGESPDTAAARILREQLPGVTARLGPPRIVSEVYSARRFPETREHWDLEFLYRGEVERDVPGPLAPWQELRFVDPEACPRAEFARSHEEVLESAGFRVGRS
jgi:ADP-ribose pyrophosphatase YjhB (NUDIX family)